MAGVNDEALPDEQSLGHAAAQHRFNNSGNRSLSQKRPWWFFEKTD
ncbi:hypothetical protein [Brevundimonas bullata]